MRRNVACRIRICVVAPDTSDRASLFENDEVVPPRELEANCHADTAKAGTDNRNRAADRVGCCNSKPLARRRCAMVDNAS
jgi:hypothetical protein